MQQVLREYRDFLLKGNVIGLAVAVVIGAAFGALVTSLVANLITPLIGALVGQHDFSEFSFTINGSVFRYGRFLNALISFLSITAAVFFFIVKPMSTINRLAGVDESDEPTEVDLLTEIRDSLVERKGS